MIKIDNLTKVYKSKRRSKVKALDNINLTLPNNGLVFVLGKSGSGKSTLLNLIGGLDSITEGTVIVDGNDISNFKEKEFCDYRNTHIGFIFQDYHLIDELTVYDNIVLSLNLRRIEDKELVSNALKKVDLEGYENRYPTELSGGERQRVAIARAIVKNPRIILADEPTGNLDTHTAKAIVEILKELSKECLILIVSHNVNDANKYADRIIELSKGKVIKDQSRNPEFNERVKILGDNIVYPIDSTLNPEDIDLINNNKALKLVTNSKKFLKTEVIETKEEKVEIEKKHLSILKELLLSLKFLKNKISSIFLSSFMVSAIMIILALSLTIIMFDSGEILESEMAKSNQTSVLMTKKPSKEISGQIGNDCFVHIENEDIQKYYENGYKGEIRKVYNYKITSSYSANYSFAVNNKFKGPYTTESLGHMIVDEEFLQKKFGDYKFLVKLDKFKDYGIVITDYMADCLLTLNSGYINKTYQDLLGPYTPKNNLNIRFYINGIIETGYKEKYEELFKRISSDKNLNSSELYSDADFQSFSNDVFDKLGYSYSFNENFFDCLSNTMMCMFPETKVLVFNDVFEFSTRNSPYITDSTKHNFFAEMSDEFIRTSSPGRYTTKIPSIPEGAKYIRVAFNSGYDEYGNTYNGVTELEYAKLRFGNGELISKDIMTYNKKIDNLGPCLDPWTGEIIYESLGADYTTVSDYIEIPEGESITEFASITFYDYAYYVFYDENKNIIESRQPDWGATLPEKTVYMSLADYNETFKTSYTSSTLNLFVPHKVKLAHYEYYDVDKKNPIFETEVTIAGLVDCNQTFLTSSDISKLFQINQYAPYTLYFDGTEGIDKVINTAGELNYEHQSYAIEGIHTMTKAVDVFIPIFELIAIVLCVGIVFILVSFSSKMIKDKMHEIGILKALGTQNKSIVIVFGLQIILIAVLTIIMSTLGYFFFIDLANDVLIESLKVLAPSHIVLDLDFLSFKLDVVAINVILISILATVSLVVPMIKIKNIKPVKIIKAKE